MANDWCPDAGLWGDRCVDFPLSTLGGSAGTACMAVRRAPHMEARRVHCFSKLIFTDFRGRRIRSIIRRIRVEVGPRTGSD